MRAKQSFHFNIKICDRYAVLGRQGSVMTQTDAAPFDPNIPFEVKENAVLIISITIMNAATSGRRLRHEC